MPDRGDSPFTLSSHATLRRAGAALTEVLSPAACVLCGHPGAHLCHGCVCGLGEPPPQAIPTGLDRLVVLCAYEQNGRDLVLLLKRRNRRGAIPLVAAALADAVASADDPVTRRAKRTVTWAPTTTKRRRRRGFDQSELLARRVALELGARCEALLRRLTSDLQGASREQRLGGVDFASPRRVSEEVVLLDDVVTSGATMSAAAGALRGAGATFVTGVALARAAPGIGIRCKGS